MRRPGLRPLLLALGALAFGAGAAAVQPAPAQREFLVEPLAERVVARLPEGPQHWRIETFSSLAAAQAAAGPLSLAAEHNGRAWLFTLGAPGGATPGGTRIAEIGPVPVVPAARYLLRVNRAGGPPGAATPVHSHPGSEAFYVLAGELSQRTPHGIVRIAAGQAMNGHAPGMAMQLTSSGAAALDQLVLFVVDADRPFSSAAVLECRGRGRHVTIVT
jgi:mannose-6-phosphate isomerase-like protein (cupin superfamily)